MIIQLSMSFTLLLGVLCARDAIDLFASRWSQVGAPLKQNQIVAGEELCTLPCEARRRQHQIRKVFAREEATCTPLGGSGHVPKNCHTLLV